MRETPSIMRTKLFWLLNLYSSYYKLNELSTSLIKNYFWGLLIIPADIAIHVAVSTCTNKKVRFIKHDKASNIICMPQIIDKTF